jgi:GAF domain-containing protein
MSDVRDVSRELRRANRALRMLSDATRILGGSTNEADLLRETCRIVVDVGGYRTAWVGFARQDDAKSIHPAAYAGCEPGYLESLPLTWADRDRGRGPAGTAIRTGQTCTVRDIQDSSVAPPPMREEASQRGYHAVIALPLLAEGRAFGVLAIYAGEADAFDAGEVEILTELAGALAVGASALHARTARARAESHLQLIRQLIDQSNDGIARTARCFPWRSVSVASSTSSGST